MGAPYFANPVRQISVLFLPIFIEQDDLYLFNENIFYKYWLTHSDQSGLINYIMPLEDIDEILKLINSQENLENLDIWVVDCVRYEPHYSHSHLEQTLNWINELKPKKAYLTHMGHWLDYKELKNKLPNNVEPSYDGLTLICS